MPRASKPGTNKITKFFKPLPPPQPCDAAADAATEEMRLRSATKAIASGSTTNQKKDAPGSQPLQGASFSDPSSALSSLPESMTASQTTVKNRVIQSSDGEDSDDLEDLHTMLGRSVRKLPAQTAQHKGRMEASLRSKAPVPAKATPPIPKPRAFKFSLERIVADKAKANTLGDEIVRARELFEEANREVPIEMEGVKPSTAMMNGAFGEGQAARLMGALDRKDAWRVNKTWHFFDLGREGKKRQKNPFPVWSLKSGWEAMLRDLRGRQEAFLLGVVADMIQIGDCPPDEVLVWMMNEMALERRQDLSYAYYNALCRLSAQNFEKVASAKSLSSLFENLGGTAEAIDVEQQITPTPASRRDDTERDFWGVGLVARFIGEMATHISLDASMSEMACKLLCRLSLDVRLVKEADVRANIEDSLAGLISAASKDGWKDMSVAIGHNLMVTVVDAANRWRLLNALPATSPRAHLFRRRLALGFLFQDPIYLTREYADLVHLHRFVKLLKHNPSFEITKESDYSELQALVCIMDVAIDDGATSGNPNANDYEVDMLVEDLRTIFSTIQDTNAQNLARTEAKDTIERLLFRLRFGVRVKEKMNLVVDTKHGLDREGMLQSKLNFRDNKSG